MKGRVTKKDFFKIWKMVGFKAAFIVLISDEKTALNILWKYA